jgi:hypothetical protein
MSDRRSSGVGRADAMPTGADARLGERLACGGAVHAVLTHRPPLWRRLIEPLLTVIAVAVGAAVVGIGLSVVGR